MVEFQVPVVDASLFLGADSSKRQLFADQLRDSLTKHGLVRVKNHNSMPDHIVEALFDRVMPSFQNIVLHRFELTKWPIVEDVLLSVRRYQNPGSAHSCIRPPTWLEYSVWWTTRFTRKKNLK